MRQLVALFLFILCIPRVHAQNWGTPVWADEFNLSPGATLDPLKWTFDIGDLHVNSEVEIYCPQFPLERAQARPRSAAAWSEISVCDPKAQNIVFDGEHLQLRAILKNGTWTSGRIKTEGRETFLYGRIEARIKTPYGAGLWPAFWGLGEDMPKLGWPTAGEIDIMESVGEIGGLGPSRIRSTIHGPGYSGDNGIRNDFSWPHSARVDSDFHTFGIIWSPFMIQYYVDDPKNVFFTVTPRELPVGTQWVYNRPFYLILNLAVGSARSWSGATDSSTPNPADMLVDYVRLYKAAPIAAPEIHIPATHMKTGADVDIPIKLNAKHDSGRMYLDCDSNSPGVHCSVRPYVVDFSTNETADASIHVSAQKSPIDSAEVHVTAYTLSGDKSSATAKISFK